MSKMMSYIITTMTNVLRVRNLNNYIRNQEQTKYNDYIKFKSKIGCQNHNGVILFTYKLLVLKLIVKCNPFRKTSTSIQATWST